MGRLSRSSRRRFTDSIWAARAATFIVPIGQTPQAVRYEAIFY
jgi:hypothetical protein